MSFLLNVSNANSKSEEFSLKDIEVFVDSEEQKWFKRAHVGKFIGKEDIWTSLNGLEKCEILTRQELIPTRHGTPGWYGPRDQQNKMDKFLSFFGGMYVMMSVPTTLWGYNNGSLTQKDDGLKHNTLIIDIIDL